MEAWGFKDSGSEIVWRKTGNIGTGYRTRDVHEHLLIGIKDKSPTWEGTTIPSVIEAPRPPGHSAKPAIFYDVIQEAVSGSLEMFGRKWRKGWTVVGDQIVGDGPQEGAS